MVAETRNCQNCKRGFTVESEDFEFYKKISVPAPTFCFDCRLQRRMAWRNERTLYKRKCNAPGHTEDIISMYAPETPYQVVDTKYWWSDAWDALESGRDYDFSRPFFTQFEELTKRAPLLSLSLINSVNSDYTNYTDGNKNCYLAFGAGWNENVNYSNKIMHNKDSQDLLGCSKCELAYECVNCFECYRLLYSLNCKSCSNSSLLYNCRNCQNCFGCANLNSKSYCIFNVQYTKEQYTEKMKELNVQDPESFANLRERFRQEIYFKIPHRYANIFNSVDCTGDNINNGKNCKSCFDVVEGVEDSRFMYGSLTTKDSYDGNGVFQNPLSYEDVDANVGQNVHMSLTIYASNDISYSWNCHSCKDLFGCVGLRNKQYCILNEQYTKEEYRELLPKVIEHMQAMPYVDSRGRSHGYGEFFPIAISPFAYNEAMVQEYFTLSKEEIASNGFLWRDTVDRKYAPTMKAEQIPTALDFPDSVLQEVIECPHRGQCHDQCTTAFKLIPAEVQFYRRVGLPLPRLCPNCRHYNRLKQRTPIKLWERQCQCSGLLSDSGVYANTAAHAHGTGACQNKFQTAYAPERKEIIYCEQCYQKEVV